MVQGPGSKGKVAWCIPPVLCGVTTAYRVVGAGLRRLGWEVVGVAAGAGASREADLRFVDGFFEFLLPSSADVRQTAAGFVRWVAERRIDIVFSTGQMFSVAAAPALPAHVKLFNRCPNTTRYTYAVAASNLSRLVKIVVSAPRQQRDLIRDWGVPPEKCVMIPPGIEVETFVPGTARDFNGVLRLVYLGRLDEASKGVMMLPRIARQLVESGIEFHFDVIGGGPDSVRLGEAFGRPKLHDRITFHGSLDRLKSLPILQQAHMFLLPSRYEGQPWALLEAMACGCVPIVSRIAGATDFAVDHGVSGFLCTVGDVSAFSKAIVNLAGDRRRLAALSMAAHQTIRDRFSSERAVRDHDSLFEAALTQQPPACSPIPVSAIQVPNMMGPGWRRFVPQPVKNYIRTWAARFGKTV